jgi:competence protein ComEC
MIPRSRIAAAAALLLVSLAVRAAFPGGRLTATVFDIGQGDSIMVQCGRHQLLVDGGPDAAVLAKLGRTMPFFDRAIDAVVLTHPHADHYAGLAAVLRRYKVRRLFISGAPSDSPAYRNFEEAAIAGRLVPTPLIAGDVITLGDCGRMETLWPAEGIAAGATKDPHEATVVLRVTVPAPSSPSAAMLLTGDPTDAVERSLIARNALIAADVLKVGHHGSRTATSGDFLDAVDPRYAVISAGRHNMYGHPHEATLLRLSVRRIGIFRTDVAGDVHVRIDVDRAYVEGY